MNLRTFLLGGCGLCLALLMTCSAHGQIRIKRIADDDLPMDLVPKVKGFERTDLFSHYPPVLPDPLVLPGPLVQMDTAANAHALVAAAKTFYLKLKRTDVEKPGSISAENLQGASLVWFKAQLAISKSRSEYIQAAAEYLEREGIPVGRSPDNK